MAEPFETRDDIKAWLRTQPRDVIFVFAARAALRSLPRLIGVLNNKKTNLPALSLSCFWATSVSLSSGRWAAQSDTLRKTALDAHSDAYMAYTAKHGSADDAAGAAYAAYAAYAYSNSADAAEDAEGAAHAAYAAYPSAYAAAYAEYSLDRDFINSGKLAEDLASSALWSDKATKTFKDLAQNWVKLKAHLKAQDENWWVWTDWYEDRLLGNAERPFTLPFVEAVEIGEGFKNGRYGRCTLPKSYYKNPAKANAAIAEIIQDYWERQKEAQDNDVSDDIDDIIDATPLGEDLTLRDDGTFDVEFLPVHDLFAKNLKRIEDAIAQALKANAFNEDSQEIKFLREIVHVHADDPQRIHDDCGFAHSAIKGLITKEIISDGFAVERLLNAIDQTQLHIRAYEPEVRKAYEAVSGLSVNETVEIDNEGLKASAEHVEHTQSERLQSEIATDISIVLGGARGAAAYRLLSRFSRMYQLIKNSAHNHVLTDAASLSLMQAMPHIGNIIQYLRQIFGL